jgi:hypothetical protein
MFSAIILDAIVKLVGGPPPEFQLFTPDYYSSHLKVVASLPFYHKMECPSYIQVVLLCEEAPAVQEAEWISVVRTGVMSLKKCKH